MVKNVQMSVVLMDMDDSGETIRCDNCWYYKGCEACLDDECNERK